MEERIATGPMAPRNDNIIDVPVHQQRSLATVTAEIRTIRAARDKMFLEASVEIGRRLKEAKELVGHGGWGDYCKTELDFSQQTAQNHIRLFEAYAADQIRLDGAALKSKTLGDLSYTQALELLALPSEEEREEFVRGHDMDQLSTRELHAEIARLREEKEAAEDDAREINAQKRQAEARAEEADKQCLSLRDALAVMQKERKADEEQWKTQAAEACEARDAALKEAGELAGRLPALQREKEAAEAAQKAAEADKKLLAKEKDRAEKEAKAAQKALDEARKNPQVPQEVLDRLKREAEEAARKAAEAEQAAAVQAARTEADKQCQSLQAELEAAQKALKLAEPEMAAFKVRFEGAQEALNKAVDALWALPPDKVDGGVRALRALLDKIGKRLEEERYEAAMPE